MAGAKSQSRPANRNAYAARSGGAHKRSHGTLDRARIASAEGVPDGIRRVCVDHAGIAYCVICQRKARGRGYCYQLKWDAFPYYQFCSKRCQDIGVLRANSGNLGMIEKTAREQRAIKAARKNFAEVITELGLMPPFHGRSADDIDRIIEACVDGFQRSMVNQPKDMNEFDDQIPF